MLVDTEFSTDPVNCLFQALMACDGLLVLISLLEFIFSAGSDLNFYGCMLLVFYGFAQFSYGFKLHFFYIHTYSHSGYFEKGD